MCSHHNIADVSPLAFNCRGFDMQIIHLLNSYCMQDKKIRYIHVKIAVSLISYKCHLCVSPNATHLRRCGTFEHLDNKMIYNHILAVIISFSPSSSALKAHIRVYQVAFSGG